LVKIHSLAPYGVYTYFIKSLWYFTALVPVQRQEQWYDEEKIYTSDGAQSSSGTT